MSVHYLVRFVTIRTLLEDELYRLCNSAKEKFVHLGSCKCGKAIFVLYFLCLLRKLVCGILLNDNE